MTVLFHDCYYLILESSRLDPNDPRNAGLLLLLESLPNSFDQVNYFQMVDVESVQSYISDDQLLGNRRFSMLCSRNQGVST
jgi:hypothetical protein